MKKILFVVISLIFMASIADAKLYVCLSKTNGSPEGFVDIDEKYLSEASKTSIMIEADESYRGLAGYQIKYENQKLRKATKKEIDDYKQAQDEAQKLFKKQKALELLGLTKGDIEKIKKLPKE